MKSLACLLLLFISVFSFSKEEDRILTINPIGHKGTIRTLLIDNNENIVTAGYDKVIKIWDSETGLLEREIYGQIGPGSEGMIYTMSLSPNNKYLAVSGWMGSTLGTEAVGDIRLYDYKSGELLRILDGHYQPVHDLEFSNSKYLYSYDGGGNVYLWDVTTGDVWSFGDIASDVSDIDIFGEYLITTHYSGMVNMWSTAKPEKPIRSYNKLAKENLPCGYIACSPNLDFIAVASQNNVIILDEKLKETAKFWHGKAAISKMDISPDGTRLLVAESSEFIKKNKMKVYELENNEWFNMSAYYKHEDLVLGAAFINNETCVTAGGLENEIVIWKPIYDKKYSKEEIKIVGAGNPFYSVAMNGNNIAFSTKWSKNFGHSKFEKVFNLQSRNVSTITSEDGYNRPVEAIGDLLMERNRSGGRESLKVKKGNSTLAFIKRNEENGSLHNVSTFIGDSLVISGGGYGFVEAYTIKGKLVSSFIGHEGDVWGMSISSDNKYLITCSNDQTIKLWNIQDIGEKSVYPVVSMFIGNNNEWVVWNNDGFFTASKKGAKYVGYHVNQGKEKEAKFYPFEQFDLKYNRPDIIMSDIGLVDESIIELYHLAYLKRLKRMGLTEEDLSGDLNLPNVEVTKKKESKGLVEINLLAEDKKFELNRINVFINDVPVYGRNGIDVSTENTKKIQKTVDLELMSGRNKIQVSVLNNVGVESLKETFFINNNTSEKPDLYLLSIGVSAYQDSTYNLDYASKDASDINGLFMAGEVYENVHKELLIDADVTKKGILDKKAFLNQAGRDDVVMVFIAGHGVLDKNLDYYYCTHDIDFNRPAVNGISYDKLESLIDGISAIRKLLIMDTCHSGEVDKDDIEEIAAVETSEMGDIVFRSTNATTTLTQRQGLKATNEAVKEMFNDLKRGTGATILSSAGGVEFAMESEEWQNGLFTYCLLTGLASGNADLNTDGEIYLSELQEYVHNQVIELSKGKQQPTSRFENISLDYRIW